MQRTHLLDIVHVDVERFALPVLDLLLQQCTTAGAVGIVPPRLAERAHTCRSIARNTHSIDDTLNQRKIRLLTSWSMYLRVFVPFSLKLSMNKLMLSVRRDGGRQYMPVSNSFCHCISTLTLLRVIARVVDVSCHCCFGVSR